MMQFGIKSKRLFLVFGLLFFWLDNTKAQIELNLLTNCTTADFSIPVQIKNFDNASSFEFILEYNPNIVAFKKSLIPNASFTLNNNDSYAIKVIDENNQLRIQWSAYYGVSIIDEALVFLQFQKVSDGNPEFSWNVASSHLYRIGDVEQEVQYTVESNLSLPLVSPYQVNFEQLVKGCRDDSENGCKAQAEVTVNGATSPLTYKWNDKFNQQTKVAIGLCQDPVSVIIRDANGCIFGGIFQASIYPANEMQIFSNPEIAYITKPNVEFTSAFLDDEPQAYKWDFGDGATATTANAVHSFEKVDHYAVSLWTRSNEGCDTTVKIDNFEVRELDFCIPNVFTPNGDNINDRWVFKIGNPPSTDDDSSLKTGIYETNTCAGEDLIFNEHFKNTHLIIINRNGAKVYECSSCAEGWDGGTLPDGVYFYVFEWEGEYSSGREQGDVTILRGK